MIYNKVYWNIKKKVIFYFKKIKNEYKINIKKLFFFKKKIFFKTKHLIYKSVVNYIIK